MPTIQLDVGRRQLLGQRAQPGEFSLADGTMFEMRRQSVMLVKSEGKMCELFVGQASHLFLRLLLRLAGFHQRGQARQCPLEQRIEPGPRKLKQLGGLAYVVLPQEKRVDRQSLTIR